MNNNKYLTLVRREFWEHRSLWLTPSVVAGLLLCAATFGALNISRDGVHFTASQAATQAAPPDAAQYVGAISLLGIAASIGLFAGLVTLAYLLDCLFAERKDRSILFWKSLPVSDAETVLTKLMVALLLVPLFVLVLAVLLQPLLAGIAALRVPVMRPQIGALLGGSLTSLPRLIGIGIFSLLWYAPLAAYLMLASVVARRVPAMYAMLPPVAIGVAEVLTLGSNRVFHFVGGRLWPWFERAPNVFNRAEVGQVINDDWGKLFADPALWLGVVAAAAMVYAVIRVRRYRDDT